MNQEKIGSFIADARKKKNLTQAELGEKLGVTEKSISNWENGRNTPDLSLFKPLCRELDITINELISGEKISNEDYQEKLEENIVNTIDYSRKKLSTYNHIIDLIIIIFGLFIAISAIMIFPSESSWSSIYSVFGIIIFMIGIARILHELKWYIRLCLTIVIFIISMGILLFTDFLNVKMNDEAPMFRYKTLTIGDVIYYDTPFYDVFRCNFDTEDEYWEIKPNKKYKDIEIMNYCNKNMNKSS